MKTEIKLITPKIAKEILNTNKVNRPVTTSQVDFYALQMIKEQWKLTGQGIQISEYGNLIDGQHRLHAVVKADKSIPFLIIYGVSEKTFDVMDQGKKRTAGDVLAINKVTQHTQKAAFIAGYLYMLKQNNPSLGRIIVMGGHRTRSHISNTDILQFYNSNQELCDEISNISQSFYKKFRLLTKSVYGSTALFLIHGKKHSKEIVFSFLRQIATGQDVECNTIFLFRERLINTESGKIYKLNPTHKSKMMTRTWNDFILQNNNRKTLVIDNEKEYNFI